MAQTATWIVSKSFGMDDRIVSRHRTERAARDAAERRNDRSGAPWARRFRAVCVAGPEARAELVTVCGRETIRPVVR